MLGSGCRFQGILAKNRPLWMWSSRSPAAKGATSAGGSWVLGFRGLGFRGFRI